MCGNHRLDGSPVAHHHDHRPTFHPVPRTPRQWRRRAFLGELGKGTMAFAVLTPAVLAACSDEGTATSPSPSSTAPGPTTPGPTTPSSTTPGGPTDEPAPPPLTWARTDLGFVSAYVLVRGTQAAVVDTGQAGSADDIGETLAGVGLDFGDVRHVVLTHLHNDHAGSIMEVMALAGTATAYAGPDDIGGIAFDPITPVADGAEVFGLEVIATPGHTDGHISVIDHDTGLLVAGDAMVTDGGGVQGPVAGFTADIDRAHDSVRRLAELSFNTLLVGHGDPIEDRADTAVAALAAAL